MDMKMVSEVRGTNPGNYAEGTDRPPELNNRGDQIVVQGLPELTDLVRLGDSWQAALAAGLAAATVLPGTLAGLSLWNGEPSTGKCYTIDSFGSWEAITDATQADRTAIFACNNITPVAAPAATGGITIRSLSGKVYGGKARMVSGLTIVNDGWFAHGGLPSSMTAFAGDNWKVNEVNVRGLYLVPPGGCFSVNAVKAAAAAAAQQFYFIRWHEVLVAYKG